MVNANIALTRIGAAALAVAVVAALAPSIHAQQNDRELYSSARALDQSARRHFDEPDAGVETSLDDVHTAVAAYLLVPRRFPASGYSDDALWYAGRLSLDAFARFGKTGDRDAGQRLLKRLAAGYPASPLAKRVPAALEEPGSAAPPAAPAAGPATGPAVQPAAVQTAAAPPQAAPSPPPAANAGKPQPAAKGRPATPAGRATTIRSIRRTVLPDVVRVIIELDAEVAFHEERIAGPDRIFLDLSPARAVPTLLDQTLRFNSDADPVRQVRLGRHENRTTRVVLDAGGVGTYSVYAMYNPYRLVIDCTRGSASPAVSPPPALLAAARVPSSWARQLPAVSPLSASAIREATAPPVVRETAPPPAREPVPPPRASVSSAPTTPAASAARAASPPPIVGPPLPGPPTVTSIDLPGEQAVITRAPEPVPTGPPPPILAARSLAQPWSRKAIAALSPRSGAAIRDAVASLPPPVEPASPLGPGTVPPEELPRVAPSASLLPPGSPLPERNAKTPEKNSTGGFSIARQLGLGVSRIVIDPGHGGHDPGAMGKDVGEAELVLDVALRLEKLLQKVPDMEVVLTRRTDEFVSLQERTAMANREGADLFLSIHANASESPLARGVETYFLNFANNLGAAGVAARENAASGQGMASLPDLVKMIALNNKLDESRDLATMVQHAMVERLRTVNKTVKDLGVKQAPFAVLIGAAMPSVLAEVSFVTNTQDARQLRSTVYRQRIAEALANAVRKYQTSLKTVSTVAATQ
jgi:N-acetylmuramoyl-L-alanine amidase